MVARSLKVGDIVNGFLIVEELEPNVREYVKDGKVKKHTERRVRYQCPQCQGYGETQVNNLRKGTMKSCKECRIKHRVNPGDKYGKLTFIKPLTERGSGYWELLCDCGTYKAAHYSHVAGGYISSCGCIKNAEDITGLISGRLTVIKRDGSNDVGTPLWLCQCECGNTTHATASELNRKRRKSCGCINASEDLTGQRFGRLVVIDSHLPAKKARCVCDCGNETVVLKRSLKIGMTESCGCYKSEVRRESASKSSGYKHGLSRTKIYQTWVGMIARCDRPSNALYHQKGITVCKEWRNVENFYRDMGDPPSKKHSIDRIDGTKHYSCGHCEECLANGWGMNCRWATDQEQTWNLSSNKPVEYNGESKCLGEWAKLYSININTLRERLILGWDVHRALHEPVKRGRRKRTE